MKIVSIVGARPNFVKLAALIAATRRHRGVRTAIVHTGQHYDARMSRTFFDELEIPAPDVNLGVGPMPPLAQLGAILSRLETVLPDLEPDRVVVVGDVTSTLAGALAASRLEIPLAHVEAGLRSFDPTMPEEVNRKLTDALADQLFCTEASGVENLSREGIDPDRVHLVGNTMIDTLLRFRERAAKSDVLSRLDVEPGGYGVMTLHRPSTVEDRARLEPLLDLASELGLPLVFPVHPRTRPSVRDRPGLRLLDPLGYLDFVRLLSAARVVLTDSGGIQEETTVLGVPCLTLRDRTERPVTVSHGTNRVVGTEPGAVKAAYEDCLEAPRRMGRVPPMWGDGKAADRILDVLLGGAAGRARPES